MDIKVFFFVLRYDFRDFKVDIISNIFLFVVCYSIVCNYFLEKIGFWCLIFGFVNIFIGIVCLMFEFIL